LDLVPGFEIVVAAGVDIVGLVPEIPRGDPPVARKCGDHLLHVACEPWILSRILKRRCAGALNPSGIVHPRLGRMLSAETRVWIPARVEEDKHRFDVV